jgi:hypothetical protein
MTKSSLYVKSQTIKKAAQSQISYNYLLIFYDQSPLTVSTPLSTTALTLARSGLLAHSTSKSSNQTLATYLSNLISIPGTGMPKLCKRFNSALSSALSSCGAPATEYVSEATEWRGKVIGETASSPN